MVEKVVVAKDINRLYSLYRMVIRMSSNNNLPPPPPYPPSGASGSDESGKILLIVIAVIVMMVVGTVFFAAVMYMSLPGPDEFLHASGELIYDENMSEPDNGIAYFTVDLHQPTVIESQDIVVRVYNSHNEEVTSQMDVDWISDDGDTALLRSGDELRISSPHEIYGYWVVLRIGGDYYGIISCYIPSE